jgi:hypothetical protein
MVELSETILHRTTANQPMGFAALNPSCSQSTFSAQPASHLAAKML